MNATQLHNNSLSSVESAQPPLRIGLAGFGNVGSGVFEVLQQNQAEIQRRCGRLLQITHIASLDLEAVKAAVGSEVALVKDATELATNPDIDVVVELIGGTGIAKTLIETALTHGKHVVTANKALLAQHGQALFAMAAKAREGQGNVLAFEAAVAGGIPIIKILREGLAANQIDCVAGIINGTTNFILSQMREKNWSFQEALAEAQVLGYAEADPRFDIEGIDAAHKITLLSSLAFGTPIQLANTYTEGIADIQLEDILHSEALGYRIKLLGIAKRHCNPEEGTQKVEVRVHPTLVPHSYLLSQVEGAMNAVMVEGNAVGTTLYYGKGAGGRATASAVIADLVDIARLPEGQTPVVPYLGFQPQALVQPEPSTGIDETCTSFYLRLKVLDQAGVLNQITGLLAEAEISIDAMVQPPNNVHSADTSSDKEVSHPTTDLILLTYDTSEAKMKQVIEKLYTLPIVQGPVVRIRKESWV